MPQRRIGREWLVLRADGTIAARRADMPVFDPARPSEMEEDDFRGSYHGVKIRQQDAWLTIVTHRVAQVDPIAPPVDRGNGPMRAHPVSVGPEHRPVLAHLRRHCLDPRV